MLSPALERGRCWDMEVGGLRRDELLDAVEGRRDVVLRSSWAATTSLELDFFRRPPKNMLNEVERDHG